MAQRDLRHKTAYEVVEAQVFTTKGSFRGMVSRRLKQGYELYGDTYFYHKKGELWAVQALVNYALRQGREVLDSSQEDSGRCIGFASKPSASIPRKKEAPK
jgi:hypothetical protein